jgi:hypothetical protein
VLLKLARVVKVCVGEEVAVTAQNRAVKQAVFHRLIEFIT